MTAQANGSGSMVSLATAAAELRLTWRQAYDALLSGKLVGEYRGSRWFVRAASIERYRMELAAHRLRPRRRPREDA